MPSPAVCVRSLVQMLASSVISFMRRTPLPRWLCRPQDADLVRIGRIVRARLLVQFYGHRRVSQRQLRSEEHTSELQSLMRISYAVFCLTKKIDRNNRYTTERLRPVNP